MKTHLALCLACLAALNLGCSNVFERPTTKLERKMMFHPQKVKHDAPVPDGVESVWFDGDPNNTRRVYYPPFSPSHSAGGFERVPLKLHGVLAEAPNPPQRRAVALYCHGNAGCVDGCAAKIRLTAANFGLTILAFDYRGFGRSEGTPDKNGIVADARAARRWLAERSRIAERDVLLIGESLGGAVAVELAATDGCRGLVLISTFSSLGDIAEELAPAVLRPRAMVGDSLNSIASIKNYHGMLLQRHGDADPLIPFAQGEALFAAAPGPKKFVAVPGGGHNDGGTPEFYSALDEFIHYLPPESSAAGGT